VDHRVSTNASEDNISSVTSAAVAVSCLGVTKVFPLIDGGQFWRVLLRGDCDKCVTAVSDVWLDVPKGKMVGILGRNGAGKSTLLRLCARVYAPTAGTIASEGSLSGLFELGGLGNRLMTGRSYAERILGFQGVQFRDMAAKLNEVRAFSELGSWFDQPIYTYSSGMAARLYFSAATALEHDVYLIDEILAVGDEDFQAKCWGRMRDRLSRGASGILVTHDWSAVLRLCEVSHLMDRGRIVDSGPTERIVRKYIALERPLVEVAAFSSSSPTSYVMESQRDAEFAFGIEVAADAPVTLAYSVEMLRVGVGWYILLLADDLPVAPGPGKYDVQLVISRLPLAAGRYYFNLFLTSPRGAAKGEPVKVYDARSWTHGNALDLFVTGTPSRGAVVLPLDWKVVAVHRTTR